MPKVDPQSGEPLSDDPDGPPDLAGGKGKASENMPEGTNPQGSSAPASEGRSEGDSEPLSPEADSGTGTGSGSDSGKA